MGPVFQYILEKYNSYYKFIVLSNGVEYINAVMSAENLNNFSNYLFQLSDEYEIDFDSDFRCNTLDLIKTNIFERNAILFTKELNGISINFLTYYGNKEFSKYIYVTTKEAIQIAAQCQYTINAEV